MKTADQAQPFDRLHRCPTCGYLITNECLVAATLDYPYPRCGAKRLSEFRTVPEAKPGTTACGCGHDFPVECGKYGCPNCEGESATHDKVKD